MKQPRPVVVVIIAVFAALLLAVSGCSLDGGSMEFRDPDETIVVEKGDEFTIVLESNPSTGYQWRLAAPLDEEVVTLERTEFVEPEEELPGAEGEEEWVFEATGLGETTISFVYGRPWEVPVQPHMEEEEPDAGAEESPMEEVEVESPGEEEPGEEPQPIEVEPVEEPEELEGLPLTRTFIVDVRKADSLDKEPKEYEDPETTIEVDRGLKFAIVLESNPPAGYTWHLDEAMDEEVVELVKVEYEKKSGEHAEEEGEEVPAGEETWTFVGVGVGETEISFTYMHWDEEVPGESKVFTVKVNPIEEDEETEEEE